MLTHCCSELLNIAAMVPDDLHCAFQLGSEKMLHPTTTDGIRSPQK